MRPCVRSACAYPGRFHQRAASFGRIFGDRVFRRLSITPRASDFFVRMHFLARSWKLAWILAFLADLGGIEGFRADLGDHWTVLRDANFFGEKNSHWRRVVSIASNCRWVSPRVGESAGTVGQRTCSAGDCASTPSVTQVL